jgi:HSP20 family protein
MANNITRWAPFREMVTMQNLMDRFFEDNWRPFMDEDRMGASPLAIDVHEDASSYTITTELAGVKADDINVRQDGDFILIEAETHDQSDTQPGEGRRALIKERYYGRYSRRLRLPQNVDFDRAEANYQDGVLTLTLPKSARSQPRTIQVKSGGNGDNRKK